jgi:beta-lactam-binding protein with PASTA domain
MPRGRARTALARQTVPVPDLIGLSVSEAAGIVGELDLSLVTPDGAAAVSLPGLIVRRQPGPGERLPRAHDVIVWTAGGGEATGVREPRTPPPRMSPPGTHHSALAPK